MTTTTITAFYRFAPVEDPAAWAEELRTAGDEVSRMLWGLMRSRMKKQI